MLKQHRLTADDLLMGAHFKKMRQRLRPDLAEPEAFGEALRPRRTGMTVRYWDTGHHPIPDKMKRVICKILPCELADFFPKTGALRAEELAQRLRRDAQSGLTYEIAELIVDNLDGEQRAEEWAQKYQELGDQQTADFIRSEAKRMAGIVNWPRGSFLWKDEDEDNGNGNDQAA